MSTLLLSNKNPVCSLLPFVSITLFSVGAKWPMCPCYSSVLFIMLPFKTAEKLIDYSCRIVTATIEPTRRLWFCCCWSFFLFRHMSLVRICISLGEIFFSWKCVWSTLSKSCLYSEFCSVTIAALFRTSSGKQCNFMKSLLLFSHVLLGNFCLSFRDLV